MVLVLQVPTCFVCKVCLLFTFASTSLLSLFVLPIYSVPVGFQGEGGRKVLYDRHLGGFGCFIAFLRYSYISYILLQYLSN